LKGRVLGNLRVPVSEGERLSAWAGLQKSRKGGEIEASNHFGRGRRGIWHGIGQESKDWLEVQEGSDLNKNSQILSQSTLRVK